MIREPGFYWISLKRPGSLPEEVAYFDGVEWHSVTFAAAATDAEVDVLSHRLAPPSEGDGSTQG